MLPHRDIADYAPISNAQLRQVMRRWTEKGWSAKDASKFGKTLWQLSSDKPISDVIRSIRNAGR